MFALCYGHTGPSGSCTASYFVGSDMDADDDVDLEDFAMFALWFDLEPDQQVPDCWPHR